MRVILLMIAVGAGPVCAAAQGVQIVHRFEVAPHAPRGGLVQAADGDLYGTTSDGGDGGGTLYRLAPGGVIEVVHRFSRGRHPGADLVRGQDGYLYGTTHSAGPYEGGAVFRFDPATRVLATLHVFALPESLGPVGAILAASDGLLYGTLSYNERLYSLDPTTGHVRWLHTFTYEEGSVYGSQGLVEAPNGAIYGVLTRFSAGIVGAVYRLDRTTGAITVIHEFTSDEAGAVPIALTRTHDGVLYGVRAAGYSAGAGHIFRVDPATDTVTAVHALNPAADGPNPNTALVEATDGSLYGTTGTLDGGTIFRLERLAGGGHAFQIVQALDRAGTGLGMSRLALASDGWLYGPTASGGAQGGGAIVRVDSLQRGPGGAPSSYQFQIVASFSSRDQGWRPVGAPVSGSDGALYGITAAGGQNELGTVYRLDPVTMNVAGLGSLPPGGDAFSPPSGLIDGGDGSLYAMAGTGIGGRPTLVKVTPATSSVTAVSNLFPSPEVRRVHPMLVRGSAAGLMGLLEDSSGLQAYRLDPASLTVTNVANVLAVGLPFYSEARVLAAPDGRLYASYATIYSGRPPTFVGEVLRIDPGTGAKTSLATTRDGYYAAALAIAPDGRIFIGGLFDAGASLRAIDPVSGAMQPLCVLPAHVISDIEVVQDGSLLVTARTASGPALYRCSATTTSFTELTAWPAGVDAASIGLAAGGLVYGVTAGYDHSGTIFRLAGVGQTPMLDRDGDGLGDDWESAFRLDPTSPTGADGAGADPDGDGQTNLQEYAAGTHPRGAFTRYLAEGATNAFFRTTIALGNDTLVPAAVLLRFQTDAGAAVPHFVEVPPTSRRTVDVGAIAVLERANFSTVVESDVRVTVDRTMSWDATGYGSTMETALAAPGTTWYLAEGSTAGDFELFYLLQNPNATAVTATVRYLRPSGLAPIERPYTLPPHSRTTIYVDEQGPELASTDVSAVIEAPAPIIVERAMYRSRPGQPFVAGHASAGVTAPALEWFLAEGATGAFFDLFVLVANPNPTPAQITAEYLQLGGGVLTKSYTVPANGRFTIWVDDETIPAGSGLKPLADAALSTTIRSTNGVPVIVERTMWWPGPAVTPNFWYEAHNSPGSTATAFRWGIAGAEIAGADGAETYVLIANTTATPGRVLVRLYFENGNTTGRLYDLPAQSRTNVPLGADFPEAVENGRAAVVVESVGASLVPVAVEAATYGSPGGVVWSRGSDALATPIPDP